jgi:hypothetical protein
MAESLMLEGTGRRRIWSFISGAGMIAASVLTIQHFYGANFPVSIFKGAFCDLSAFLTATPQPIPRSPSSGAFRSVISA